MDNLDKWLNLENIEKKINLELNEALQKSDYPVFLNEFYVLYFLNESKDKKLSISDLSKKTGLSISATSRMLIKFEKSCEVIGRKEGKDKRSVVIFLTSKGETYLEENMKIVNQILEKYKSILEYFKASVI